MLVSTPKKLPTFDILTKFYFYNSFLYRPKLASDFAKWNQMEILTHNLVQIYFNIFDYLELLPTEKTIISI